VKTNLWLYKLQNGAQLVLVHIILNFEPFVSNIIHLLVTKTDYFGSVRCRVLMKKPTIFITLSTNAHHPILASGCVFSPPSDIKISVRFVLIQSVPLIFSHGGDSCRRNCVSAYTKPASAGNFRVRFSCVVQLALFHGRFSKCGTRAYKQTWELLQIFFYVS
jgi:hypothetical protein